MFADVAWGFLLVALANAIDILLVVDAAPSLGLKLAHLGFDAAEVLGLGVVAGAIAALAFLGATPSRGRAVASYAALVTLVALGLVGEQFERLAHRPGPEALVQPIKAAMLLAVGFGLPLLHLAARHVAAKGGAGTVLFLLALAGMAANHALLRDDYEGTHAIATWATALGAGPWLHRRLGLGAKTTRWLLVAVLVLGGVGFGVAPPNAVRIELFRQPGMAGPWILSALRWSVPLDEIGAPGSASPPSSSSPASPVPLPSPSPSPRRRLPRAVTAPVVVLMTIDAARADAIDAPPRGVELPNLSAMKRTGAYFERAVAPGSQTAVSLSSLFSGKYLSQLLWEPYGSGRNWFPFPARDPSVRFPALLSSAGVETAAFCTLRFLADAYGVVRGFRDEQIFAQERYHAALEDLWNPLMARLDRAALPEEAEPLFLYVHAMEAHSPYDRGALRQGSAYERYVSELAVIDRYIGELRALLARRFAGRGYLFVSADHGEAFGEHGTTEHSKTLYEELLHVPLLVEGPGVQPRRISDLVGLIDLGPTILDLFGLEAPASFVGRSLLPLLGGEDRAPFRPLLAEGRYRRAIYSERHKLIEDGRRKTVELFDLAADPRELDNRFAREPDVAREMLGRLRGFYAEHELRRNPLSGEPYQVPLVR